MSRATRDRGEIINWAGRNKRSPALKNGAPVFLGHGAEPDSVRCGWEPFFDAMRDRDLLVALSDDAEGARFVPATEASPDEHASFPAQIADAKRFGQSFLAFAKRALGPKSR